MKSIDLIKLSVNTLYYKEKQLLVKNKFLKESNSKIIGGIFMSKILIKNGTVIDGSRSARFQADVLVEEKEQ